MKTTLFTGSGVALVTPFTEDGVNYEVLKELIEFQIENGTDAIVVCGTTGEPSTMTFDEWKGVVEFTVKNVKGRIAVIAGNEHTGISDSWRHLKNSESIIIPMLGSCESLNVGFASTLVSYEAGLQKFGNKK